jgi:predicted TIM-barrel fold metal-dependent hydrolase
MTIDMHAHWIPSGLTAALRNRTAPPNIVKLDDGRETMGVAGFSVPLTPGFDDVATRLAEMDRHGIDRGVLSLTTVYGVESLPVAEALPLCRAFNDAVSQMCVDHPDRFSGLASLPAAEVGAAVAEFERAMALPGMVGALLLGDGFLSRKRAEQFRPLFEAADRHHAILLVHYGMLADDPTAPKPDASDNTGARMATLDMQARLSSNMVTFCLTDFLDAFPNVTVLSHNLGGNIPFEIERMDHRALVAHPDAEVPSKKFKASRVMVDCNSFGARGIELAVGFWGARRIVLGTDGTDFGMKWSQDAIAEANISDADKRAILNDNAARLLAPFLSRTAAAAE